MNKTFRIIWNKTKQLWQCVSEETRSHGKTKSEKCSIVSATTAAAALALSTVLGITTLPTVAQAETAVQSANREAKLVMGYYSSFDWAHPIQHPQFPDPGRLPASSSLSYGDLAMWAMGNMQVFVGPGTQATTADYLNALRDNGPSGVVDPDGLPWLALNPYTQSQFSSAYQNSYGYEVTMPNSYFATFQGGIRVERGVHIADGASFVFQQKLEDTISGQIVLGTAGTSEGVVVHIDNFVTPPTYYADHYGYTLTETQSLPTTQKALNLSSTSSWGATQHNALFRSLNTGAHTLDLFDQSPDTKEIDWTTLASLAGNGRNNTTFTTLTVDGDVAFKNVLDQDDKLTTVKLELNRYTMNGAQAFLSSNLYRTIGDTQKAIAFQDIDAGIFGLGSTVYVDQGNTLLFNTNVTIAGVETIGDMETTNPAPTTIFVANDDVVILEGTNTASSSDTTPASDTSSAEEATNESAANESTASPFAMQISHLILTEEDKPYWMGNQPQWKNAQEEAWSFYTGESNLHLVTKMAASDTPVTVSGNSLMGNFASWTSDGGTLTLKDTFNHPVRIKSGVVTIEDGTDFKGGLYVDKQARLVFGKNVKFSIAGDQWFDPTRLTQGTWVVNKNHVPTLDLPDSEGGQPSDEEEPIDPVFALFEWPDPLPSSSIPTGYNNADLEPTNPVAMLERDSDPRYFHMSSVREFWDGKTVVGNWVLETDSQTLEDMQTLRRSFAPILTFSDFGLKAMLYTTEAITDWKALQALMATATDYSFPTAPVSGWTLGADSTLDAGETARVWLPDTIYVPQGKTLTITGQAETGWYFSRFSNSYRQSQSRSRLGIGGQVNVSGGTTVMEHILMLADGAQLTVSDHAKLRVISEGGLEPTDYSDDHSIDRGDNTGVGRITIGNNVTIKTEENGTIDLTGRTPGLAGYFGTLIQVQGTETNGWWNTLATTDNAPWIKLQTFVPFDVTDELTNFDKMRLWEIRDRASINVALPQVTHVYSELALNHAIDADKWLMVAGTLTPGQDRLSVNGHLIFLPGSILDMRQVSHNGGLSKQTGADVQLYTNTNHSAEFDPSTHPLILTVKVGGKDKNDSDSSQWTIDDALLNNMTAFLEGATLPSEFNAPKKLTAIDTTFGAVAANTNLNDYGLWIVSGEVSAPEENLATALRVEKGATLTAGNMNVTSDGGEVDIYGTYKQTGNLTINGRFVVHDGGVLSYNPTGSAALTANSGYLLFMPGAIYEGQLTPSDTVDTRNMWTYVVNQEGNTVWRPKFASDHQYMMDRTHLNKLRGVEITDGETLTVSDGGTTSAWLDVGSGGTLKVEHDLSVSDLTVTGTLDTNNAVVTVDTTNANSTSTRSKTLVLDAGATITKPANLQFAEGAILSTNATQLSGDGSPQWWTDAFKANFSDTTLVTTKVAKVDAESFKYWQVRGTDSGESESTATSLPAETAVFADSKLKLDMTTLPSGKVIDNYGVVRLDNIKVFGRIIGGGTVEKTGTGTTVIETAQTYAGKTVISGGTLEVRQGADLTGNVEVNAGGTYKVNTAAADSEGANYNARHLMMLRSADARDAGTPSAAEEARTLVTKTYESTNQHHANSLTINNGGVFNVVINSLTDFTNEWTVSNIYLNEGSKLFVSVKPGLLTPLLSELAPNSDLEVTFKNVLYGWRIKGQFSEVDDDYQGYKFDLIRDPNGKALHLLMKASTDDGPDKPTIIDHSDGPIDPLLSGTGKRAVLGFMHDAWGTVKPFECQTENHTAWAKLIGSHDKLDNGEEWLGYSANHKGVAVGNEVCWGDKRVGVMLSYARTEADAERPVSTELHAATKHELKADSWLVGLYGEKVHSDEFYSDAEVAVGRSHLRGQRHIYEDGLIAKSKANANLFTAGYGINWVLPNAPWGMTHFARMDFSKVWVGAYDETGAMDKNLSVAKDHLTELVLRIGTKAKKPLSDRWSFDTKVSIGVDVLNQNPATRARLLESDGPYKKVKNDEIGSLIGDFALGLTYKVTPQVQVNTNLNAQVRQNYHDVGAEVRFDYHF